MDIAKLIGVLESIPDTVLTLLNPDTNPDNWIEFALNLEMGYWDGLRSVLFSLIPHGNESLDQPAYPYMVYNDRQLGYVLVFLSRQQVIISEFGYSYRIVDSDEANNYLNDKLEYGHNEDEDEPELDRGMLLSVHITGELTEREFFDRLARAYVDIIATIAAQPVDDIRLMLTAYSADQIWENKSDASLAANLIVDSTERYQTMLEQVVILLDELDQ